MKYITTIILIAIATTSFARVLSINPEQTNAQWHSVLNNLQAGDVVYLEDGTYTNFQVDIRGNGTATNPILVRARNPGNVFIEGAIRVRMSGNFITVDGLHFRHGWAGVDNTIFQFRGPSNAILNNSRLTNSVFDSLNSPFLNIHDENDREHWIGLYHGSNNRIDNNYFGFKMVYGVVLFTDPRNAPANIPGNHIIERNFFGHRPSRPDNGAETMRLGDSERSHWSTGTIVRENIFFRTDGEIEIISIKSCDNVIEGNLFFEARGQVTLRHGHRNTVRNNVFIGNGVPQTSGVRVLNSDQRVYNNWFQGLRGTGNRSALCFQMGIGEIHPLNSHHRVINAEVAYNTFINVQRIEIGTNVSNPPSPLFAPSDSRFRNNIIFHNFTTAPLANVVPIDVVAAGRDSGITVEGNLFRVAHPTWTRPGFSQRVTLNFVRQPGALFYEITNLEDVVVNPMNCIPDLTGRGGIPSIESLLDVTGNPRLRPYTAGAINVENFGNPPRIPNLREVGPSWFRDFESQINLLDHNP